MISGLFQILKFPWLCSVTVTEAYDLLKIETFTD